MLYLVNLGAQVDVIFCDFGCAYRCFFVILSAQVDALLSDFGCPSCHFFYHYSYLSGRVEDSVGHVVERGRRAPPADLRGGVASLGQALYLQLLALRHLQVQGEKNTVRKSTFPHPPRISKFLILK